MISSFVTPSMRAQLSPGAWVICRDPEVTPPIDGGVVRGRRTDSVLERKNYSVGDWMFHLCPGSVEGIDLLNHFYLWSHRLERTEWR